MERLYRDLSSGSSEIRLVKVQPGKDLSPIVCRLETVLLKHNLEYEALSYVWGDPEGPKMTITLNDKPFSITENLHAAFERLRFPEVERTLWVDAICINQQDVSERSAQVAIMGDIFQKARRVIIWLGESTSLTGPEIQRLNQFADAIKQWDPTVPPTGISKEASPDDDKHRVLHSNGGSDDPRFYYYRLAHSNSLCGPDIMERAWWRRVWTLQEFVLAAEATFVCGEHSISWDDLNMCVSHYKWAGPDFTKPEDPLHLISRHLTFSSFRTKKLSRKTIPLLSLINAWREHSATDARDYIYAFLGLISDYRQFEPDYSKTEEEVYIDFAKHCILTTSNLNVLSAAGYHKGLKVPSWVPDSSCFSERSRPRYLTDVDRENSIFAATGLSASTACVTDNLTLQAEGWLVGIVEDVGTVAPPLENLDYMKTLSDWERVVFRKFGDSGDCSRDVCSSQGVGEMDKKESKSDDEKACKLSVACVLDHWQRRTTCASQVWPQDDPQAPCSLRVLRTSIDEPRETRLARATSAEEPLYPYWNGATYFPTDASIGEAFARTVLADSIHYLSDRIRLDKVIERSRQRDRSAYQLTPNQTGSYDNFVDAFCDSHIPKWDYLEEDIATKIFCPLCGKKASQQSVAVNNHVLLCRSLENAIRLRRFLVTVSGLMGLAPAETSPGDCVVLLKGCQVPLILRKVEDHFILLGECYVHGIMDGYLFHKARSIQPWFRYFKIR